MRPIFAISAPSNANDAQDVIADVSPHTPNIKVAPQTLRTNGMQNMENANNTCPIVHTIVKEGRIGRTL
jgi:hypothetical protein